MSIDTAIQEAIKAHLPAQMGEVLKNRLIELEKTEANLEQANKSVKMLEQQRASLTKELEGLKAILAKHEDLATREQKVFEREYKQELFEAKAEARHAGANAEFARNVALGLVRNIEYREAVSSSKSEPVNTSPAGSYPTWQTGPLSTETVTKERTVK
jgi:peptidoglycan hydrolase CwlO-like protein